MKDLYKSRKGKGSLQIELDSLKSDNEHLLQLLKNTCEYADCTDNEILTSAKTQGLRGARGIENSFEANKRSRMASADGLQSAKQKSKLNNDWIPTQAVKALAEIQRKFKNQLTEQAVSRILYELNTIWRDIMRSEQEAQRKKLTAQIQDLRRQVVTKQAFDKGELMQEITRTKRQLGFAEKQLYNKKRIGGGSMSGGKENSSADRQGQQFTADEVENSIRMVETIGIQKKALQSENDELRSRIDDLQSQLF